MGIGPEEKGQKAVVMSECGYLKGRDYMCLSLRDLHIQF